MSHEFVFTDGSVTVPGVILLKTSTTTASVPPLPDHALLSPTGCYLSVGHNRISGLFTLRSLLSEGPVAVPMQWPVVDSLTRSAVFACRRGQST